MRIPLVSGPLYGVSFIPPASSSLWTPPVSESQRQARHAAPRHSYATFHFGNKYEADAPADTGPKISSSRFRSSHIVPRTSALLPRPRISWKVESYDRYVLEIGKSIHILYALVFFIYTGRTPLHKRAEIYGRGEPRFIPFLFRRKVSATQQSCLSIPTCSPKRQSIIYTSNFSISTTNTRIREKIRDLFPLPNEKISRTSLSPS